MRVGVGSWQDGLGGVGGIMVQGEQLLIWGTSVQSGDVEDCWYLLVSSEQPTQLAGVQTMSLGSVSFRVCFCETAQGGNGGTMSLSLLPPRLAAHPPLPSRAVQSWRFRKRW